MGGAAAAVCCGDGEPQGIGSQAGIGPKAVPGGAGAAAATKGEPRRSSS
jgi:hypothetical protein